MNSKFKKVLMLLFLALILSPLKATNVLATEYEKPSTLVYDETHDLDKYVFDLVTRVNDELKTKKNKIQIAVLAINKLNNESIETLANRTAKSWDIGYAPDKYGLLIVYSKEDKKFRVELSNKLSKYISNAEMSNYINKILPKHFKANNYSSGIVELIDTLNKEKLQSIAEGSSYKSQNNYVPTYTSSYSKKTQSKSYGYNFLEGIFIIIAVIFGLIFKVLRISVGYNNFNRDGYRSNSRFFDNDDRWDNDNDSFFFEGSSSDSNDSSSSSSSSDWGGGGASGGW